MHQTPTTLKSRFASKRVASVSLGIAAVLAVVGSGIGMQVAASAAVKNPGKIACVPKAIKKGKTCTITFTDKHSRTGYQSSPASGHQVCFATKAPNTVKATKPIAKKPLCALTNSKGVVTGVFSGKKTGKASITAKETLHGADEGTLTLSVTVS